MRTTFFILIFISILSNRSLSQTVVVETKAAYDSLVAIAVKKSFKDNDTSSIINIRHDIKYESGDTVLINKIYRSVMFLSYIKRNGQIKFGIYRHTEQFETEKSLKGKRIITKPKLVGTYHVFLVDTTGEEVAYVMDYGNDLYYKTENDSLLLFRNKKVPETVLSIDPLSDNLEILAQDSKNGIYLLVRLLFYEDKTKTKATIHPKR